MTTRGRSWRTRNGYSFPLAPYGDVRLADLPALIDELETVRGEPLVVDLPADLSPAHQRLMGTLGVAVRFTPARAAVRDALSSCALDDELTRRARRWLEEAE